MKKHAQYKDIYIKGEPDAVYMHTHKDKPFPQLDSHQTIYFIFCSATICVSMEKQ